MIATIINYYLLLSSNIKHKFTHRVNFSRNYLELSKTFLTFAAHLILVIKKKWQADDYVLVVYALQIKEDHIKPRVLHSGLSVCNSATNPLVVQPATKAILKMINTNASKRGGRIVYCRYIRRNGKIYFPKKARCFRFWVK